MQDCDGVPEDLDDAWEAPKAMCFDHSLALDCLTPVKSIRASLSASRNFRKGSNKNSTLDS